MNDAGDRSEPFFIGWAKAPTGLRPFLIGVGLCLVVLFGGVGFIAAATQADPGSGRGGRGETAIGVLTYDPYPLLYVTESERYPTGHTLLLSGNAKFGVQDRASALDGRLVQVSGGPVARGDLDMLRLRNGPDGLSLVEGAPATPEVPEPVPLGRWRLTGEICDGQCYGGAMRPGTGLAHRACANLCLIGGVPPVFVSTQAVAGEEFLLLADAEGGPVTDAVLDHVAMLVDVEGEVERRGDLLVFRIDPASLQVAP
ncbi:MAG: hypothetical protein H6843_17420 [Rhodospirillaceae bacterium]|nr:hypothetical protein [Rhodospirillaceae bacterium]